jgi:diguanylate cyclase (GGDEF)-like protein
LPNRLLLLNRLEYALDIAARAEASMAVLYLDIDRFKVINESLGHDVGDRLLMAVAHRLRNIIRRSDIVARLGGDEFVLVLTDFDSPVYVAHVAGKLLTHLLETLSLEGHRIRVTGSIGISIFPQDGRDARTLLRSADIAMYRAKEEGRNGFRFFDPTMNSRALERLDLESNLRQAVEAQEFVLHFQPKVMLADRSALGTEALIRWQHPKRGLVPPIDFIALAEETGLIVPIGAWVLRAACEQTQLWRCNGAADLTVAVNLSARQFNQPDLVAEVRRVLEETGLPPPALDIELTESTVMDGPEQAIATLRQLRDLGVRVAVDDFGTGYSSLSYLKKLPINSLKIDRSFITDLINDQDDAAIVQTIIALGKVLRLEVVAEGVETAEQANFLADNGCHIGQGYFFARPLPASDFVHWLRHSQEPRTG